MFWVSIGEMANPATDYFTKNVDRTWRLFENLEAGMIGMNTGNSSAAETPFGGIKESGYGKESGKDVAIAEYMVSLALSPAVVEQFSHTNRPSTDHQDRYSYLVGSLLRVWQFVGRGDLIETTRRKEVYSVAIGVQIIVSSQSYPHSMLHQT
jgi:hypothetical protein